MQTGQSIVTRMARCAPRILIVNGSPEMSSPRAATQKSDIALFVCMEIALPVSRRAVRVQNCTRVHVLLALFCLAAD